jgi:hypothetical protein
MCDVLLNEISTTLNCLITLKLISFFSNNIMSCDVLHLNDNFKHEEGAKKKTFRLCV